MGAAKYKEVYSYLLRTELKDALKWRKAANAAGVEFPAWVSHALNLRAEFVLNRNKKIKAAHKSIHKRNNKIQKNLFDPITESFED